MQRYYATMHKLQKEGFVEVSGSRGKKLFSITRLGKKKLIALREQQKRALPTTYYKKEKGDRLVIIAFDIPEKEKRKREWLRASLKNLDMEMIQRSVWMGKIKLPAAFLEDLRKLRIFECVAIFQITKSGNLKHIE